MSNRIELIRRLINKEASLNQTIEKSTQELKEVEKDINSLNITLAEKTQVELESKYLHGNGCVTFTVGG